MFLGDRKDFISIFFIKYMNKISEDEVCFAILKWLLTQQRELNKQNKILGFFTGLETNKKILDFLKCSEENKIKEISKRTGEDINFIENCWVDVIDIRIPYTSNLDKEMMPDFMVHLFNKETNSSEIWSIEAKGEDVSSTERGVHQVMAHGYGVHKSFIAIPESLREIVRPLEDKNYGILIYSENEGLLLKNKNISTQAKTEVLNYISSYLRDYHLNKFSDSERRTLRVGRISIMGKESELVLALYIFYKLDFSKISDLNKKLLDLREIGFIDHNNKITSQFKLFFEILNKLLNGRNRKEKINDFIRRTPPKSQRDKILYEYNDFSFMVSALLNLCLSQNENIVALKKWINQAELEAGQRPTLAHVFTVGYKNDPAIVEGFWMIGRNKSKVPTFHYAKSRKGNVCFKCKFAKECYGKKLNTESIDSFNKMHQEYMDDWKNNMAWDLFNNKKLKEKYLIDFTYPNGTKIKILKPGFIKALTHTDLNKTNGLLRHAGILAKESPSGIKPELCVRNRFDKKGYNGLYFLK